MRYTVGSGSGVKRKVYFDCPTCASPVDSTLEKAGQKLPCPACGREVVIPGVAELKIWQAEEAAREVRRAEEQRAREERAAAEAKAREEKEAAEEQARAERRARKKRTVARRKAPAAARAERPAAAVAAAVAPAEAAAGPAGAPPRDVDVPARPEVPQTPAVPEQPKARGRARRLVSFPAAMALVLACAVGALWVRSYWVATRIEWGERQPYKSTWQYVHSARGAVSYERRTHTFYEGEQEPGRSPATRTEQPATSSRLAERGWTHRPGFLGFGFYHEPLGRRDPNGRLDHWELIVPYWAVCALLAVPAVISVVRRAGQRRRPSARAEINPNSSNPNDAAPGSGTGVSNTP